MNDEWPDDSTANLVGQKHPTDALPVYSPLETVPENGYSIPFDTHQEALDVAAAYQGSEPHEIGGRWYTRIGAESPDPRWWTRLYLTMVEYLEPKPSSSERFIGSFTLGFRTEQQALAASALAHGGDPVEDLSAGVSVWMVEFPEGDDPRGKVSGWVTAQSLFEYE